MSRRFLRWVGFTNRRLYDESLCSGVMANANRRGMVPDTMVASGCNFCAFKYLYSKIRTRLIFLQKSKRTATMPQFAKAK